MGGPGRSLDIDDSSEMALGDLASIDLPRGEVKGGPKRQGISFGSKVSKVTPSSGSTTSPELLRKLRLGTEAHGRLREHDMVDGVDFLARQTREMAMSVEIPLGATHRLVLDGFETQFVKISGVSVDKKRFVVEFVAGPRNGRIMRVLPLDLVKAGTDLPDPELENQLPKVNEDLSVRRWKK